MDRRLELHEIFCDLLGSRNVYFQPPASVTMQYPAIVYHRSNIRKDAANNGLYIENRAYEAIVIDSDPDSGIVDAMIQLPYCRFARHYTADNLNHDVFQIYY